MVVSSNTLFHFTKEYSTLLEILKSRGFWARYCHETRTRNEKEYDFYVPISCFCDIPLYRCKEHIEKYGHYGIGMSKEWAFKNGRICPVFYTHDYSDFLMKELFKDAIFNRDFPMNGVDDFARSQSILKPYSNQDNLYYNEREWRYIPDIKLELCFTTCNDNIDKWHEYTKDKKAMFEAADIKYLILDKETERVNLLSDLDCLFPTLKKSERSLLYSKVITIQQLSEDF